VFFYFGPFPSVVSSDVEGNVIFQETPLPKAGRPDPKALIERD
jgi:hypothetical protein